MFNLRSEESDRSSGSEEIIYNVTTDQMKFKAAAKKTIQSSQSSYKTMDNVKRLVTPAVNASAQPSSYIMSDDDFSEVEIGPDGRRVYKPRPSRSVTYQNLFGGGSSEYNGYNQSLCDSRSVRSHRGMSPMSVRSARFIDPYDANALVRSIREALALNILPLQELTRITNDYYGPSRKRRRPGRSRCSENTMSSSEDDQRSTRSEFPMKRFKRPYSREQTLDRRERVWPNSLGACRMNTSARSLKNERLLSRSNFSRSITGFSSSRSVDNMKQYLHRGQNIGNLTMQPLNSLKDNLASNLASLREPAPSGQPCLRNLNCTETTGDNVPVIQNSGSTDSQPQKEHIFVKPNVMPDPKKSIVVARAALPVKPNPIPVTNNRLSDVSEIPELTQNSSNESMRPSFIKRKLFTQTLDVALEKDDQRDDSLPLSSPVPNIYSSVPRPKSKPSNLIPRPLLKKNIFDASVGGNQSEIRDLIEQIVPHEKMNATTGILQKNVVRSSIHEAVTNNNKENCGKANTLDSEYDSDIFGPTVRSQVATQIQKAQVVESDEAPQEQTEQYKKNKEKYDKTRNGQPSLEVPHNINKNNQVHNDSCNDTNLETSNCPQKQKTKLDRFRNSITNYVTKPCNVALNKLTHSIKDKKPESSKNTAIGTKESKGTKTGQKINNATSEVVNKLDKIHKVHNNLLQSERNIVSESTGFAGKKTVNSEVRGNKRLATGNPTRPRKVMKARKDTSTHALANSSKECNRQNKNSAECDSLSEEDHEVSFRQDLLRDRRHCFNNSSLTPNNSSLEQGVRRSARKSVRPTKYFNYSMGNTPKALKDRSIIKNNSGKKSGTVERKSQRTKDRQRSVSPTYTASEPEITSSPLKTPLSRPQANKRQQDRVPGDQTTGQVRCPASPTFTASESEASPLKTPAARRIGPANDSTDRSSAARKRGRPPKNLNSGGQKSVSPVYKVSKQKLSFGRKAEPARQANAVPTRNSGSDKAKCRLRSDKAVDRFLVDSSADEFTSESLQRSRSLSNSFAKTNNTPKTSGPARDLNSSILTRSARKAIEKTVQKKSPAPLYNVKKAKVVISKIRSPGRNGTDMHKVANLKNTDIEGNRKGKAATVDAWLKDSSEDDEEQETRNVRDARKQPTAVAQSQVPTRIEKTLGNSAQHVKQKPVNTSDTEVTSPAKKIYKPSHVFKEPGAVIKAPSNRVHEGSLNSSINKRRGRPRKDETLVRNQSLMSNRSAVNVSRLHKSILPSNIRALLPSDWEDDYTEDEAESGIRDRVDRLSVRGTGESFRKPSAATRRKRKEPSPTRSEILRPSQSLKSKAARSFARASEADERRDVRAPPRLGMSTVTIGILPSFCRMDTTRNDRTRLDDNASVASAYSFKSNSSIRSLSKKSLLHF